MRDISLHLMDLLQNSIAAKATVIEIRLSIDDKEQMLVLEINDNGCGMKPEFLRSVMDPFSTTRATRKVGLGIPLVKASAERSGGEFKIESAPEQGTRLTVTFGIHHIDRLPLGDIGDTLTGTILAHPQIRYKLILAHGNDEFVLDTLDIAEKLDEVPITEIEVIQWLKEYINEGVKIIFGGVLNEVTG